MKYFWITSIFLPCMCAIAYANSSNSLNNWLHSDSNGVWIEKRWEQYLGNSQKCRAGSIWEFKKENKLIKKICRTEKVITSNHYWHVMENEGGNERIKIDEEIFTVERLRKEQGTKDGLPPMSSKVTVIRSLRERQDQPSIAIELIQSEF